MNHLEGLIFDIQGFCVHDGPGCRTVVFLSGCPLRCKWCANPEGMEMKHRLLYRRTKCVLEKQRACTRCAEGCPRQAISLDGTGALQIDRTLCRDCRDMPCTRACLHEALKRSGEVLSVDQLMERLGRDQQFWSNGGGVTFTGGEPLFQAAFLKQVLQRCHRDYIHTAVETTANIRSEVFLDVMQHVDWAFIDLKHMDPEKHREQTGVSNELILKNVRALAQSDWDGTIMIRIPIIEQYNDTDENIHATARFLRSAGLKRVNILPFHRLGESKWQQLGMLYPYRTKEATPPERLDHIASLFGEYDITCYKGSDTPF